MIQEVKYKGYTASPSDYECGDGELAGMVNIVPDDGNLKPIPPCELLGNMGNDKLTFVHSVKGRKNYIIISTADEAIYWVVDRDLDDYGSWEQIEMELGDDEVYQINSLGNTLVVQCSDGNHYLLWKPSEHKYKYLGKKPPFVEIQFSLSDNEGEYVLLGAASENIKTKDIALTRVNLKEIEDVLVGSGATFDDDDLEINTSSQEIFTEGLHAILNRTNKSISDSGHFYANFHVRYCYRMYDGSMFYHSAPVFMPVITSGNYIAQLWLPFWKITVTDGRSTAFTTNLGVGYVPRDVALEYRILNNVKSALLEWSDIITSVDIFVSQPVTRFTFGEKVGATLDYVPSSSSPSAVLARLGSNRVGYGLNHYYYDSQTEKYRPDLLEAVMPQEKTMAIAPSLRCIYFNLPTISDEDYEEKVKNPSGFYRVASLELGSLTSSTTFKKVPIKGKTLTNLVTQERMTEDYKSHNTLISPLSYSYNNRLNIVPSKEILFEGYPISMLVPYGTLEMGKLNASKEPVNFDAITDVYVKLSTEEGEKIVHRTTQPTLTDGAYIDPTVLDYCPLFYPDTRAKKMYVFSNGKNDCGEYIMEESTLLNGAVTAGGQYNQANYFEGYGLGKEDNTVSMSNKIYTSDAGNPFVFPASGVNTIGTGSILAVSTAAKALSEGQFGQFPLYVFTDNGIWAMEVTSTGTYSARQAITRDVIVKNSEGEYNIGAISQIDSEVVFATERGIMLLSGSKSQCISEVLDEDTLFNPLALRASSTIMDTAGFPEDAVQYIPFKQYVRDCGACYDYIHQRIIIYNPNHNYAYVYSVKDKAWGMMMRSISNDINSYPNCVVEESSGKVYDLSSEITEGRNGKGIPGIIFTRPFKLGDINMLKTVDTIIQRGNINKNHVSQVLYGSRDLTNWHLVATSKDIYLRGFRGSPYKYFRLVIITEMDAGESLYGFTCQYQPRLTNKPR